MTRPFSDGDLDSAAALLAERHARHHEAEPLLPADVDFRAEVEELWRRPGVSGAVSESGFLIGAPREDPVWGPNVWVELAGHAAAEAKAARDLYALAAERWVDEGNTRHYAISLRMDTHCSRRLGQGRSNAAAPARAARAIYSGRSVRWMCTHPEENVLVAERHGAILGCVYLAVREVGLHRPRSAFLAWAATVPEARGSGLGLALTQASLAWARSRGRDVIATDWRVTNLLASRFWPARGFRSTFLRLYRSIP